MYPVSVSLTGFNADVASPAQTVNGCLLAYRYNIVAERVMIMSRNALMSALLDEIASEESNVIFYAHRKATFVDWCFDKDGARCSSDALARAGFVYSGRRTEPATAICVFCFKEMIFEKEDDPWEEHRSHAQSCSFVELKKLDEKDWTVRDLISLVSGRLAAIQCFQKQSILKAAEDFRKASEEIKQMFIKAMRSTK
ncbi:hypothetical protein KIN20_006232 [Parelaphostrongylus tenuis]|uniref:Uncharacterized protein n=1 Tax=Parelaphostrongylus tenuis TaxID=148309 RepID=A0AAD5QGJ5_PARTN|nr:hypothetical protein KIN20_006232 [Parelaphostrongylus tenuis]